MDESNGKWSASFDRMRRVAATEKLIMDKKPGVKDKTTEGRDAFSRELVVLTMSLLFIIIDVGILVGLVYLAWCIGIV